MLYVCDTTGRMMNDDAPQSLLPSSVSSTAMFSAVAVLLFLATAGQSVTPADGLHSTTTTTTLGPSPSDLVPATQTVNDSTPRILSMHHVPCREEHANFCFNGGQCMYPQDTNSPSCWCKENYYGPRCTSVISKSTMETDYEKVVGSCVAAVVFFVLLMVFLWWIHTRCVKKSPLKYDGPETAV